MAGAKAIEKWLNLEAASIRTQWPTIAGLGLLESVKIDLSRDVLSWGDNPISFGGMRPYIWPKLCIQLVGDISFL